MPAVLATVKELGMAMDGTKVWECEQYHLKKEVPTTLLGDAAFNCSMLVYHAGWNGRPSDLDCTNSAGSLEG